MSITGQTAVGGVVGQNMGTITGVYTSGSVTATDSGAGGIVAYNYGSLSNVYSASAVSAPAGYAGGIAGLSFGDISRAYATGPVSGGSYLGGLVGYLGGSVNQSYATGAVSGTSDVGGLVGYNDGGSITQSYWDSYTTRQAAGIGSGEPAISLTEVTSDPAQSAAANYAFKQSAYGDFDFTPGNTSTGWFLIDGRTRPFGQWEYSTNIANTHQLQLMAMDLGASYRLTSNIDFSSGLAVGGRYPGMWSSSGFSPIGDYSTQFAGSFDGQGRVISNLAINLPSTNYVGLFGYIRTGGAVSNVSLQAATITGQDRVGILAGRRGGPSAMLRRPARSRPEASAADWQAKSSGSVANSWAAVTVAGTTTTSSSMGGLVGWNNAGGTIQDSYATGNVTAGTGGTRAGGLTAQSNGSILRSYATGAVSGGSQGVGGLVGFNTGATIVNSYATGAVTATAFAGGLVGFSSTGATIVNSHATGAVTTTSLGGGLVGINAAGASIDRSYATGAVNVTSSTIATLTGGGLVGNNSGAVTQSYATGAVNVTSTSCSGHGYAAGGLIGTNGSTGYAHTVLCNRCGQRHLGCRRLNVGWIDRQEYRRSYRYAVLCDRCCQRHGQRRDRYGNGGRTDWQPRQHGHGRTDLRGRSGSAISPGAAAAGGLIGSITGTGAITASYWDTDTSARTNAIGSGTSTGITGLTTAQMQDPANFASTYAGWDFSTVWSAPSAGYYPQLYGVNYVLRVDPANASRVYGEANPAFTYSIYGLHTGDTAGIVTGLSVSTAATMASNAGTYAISASGGSAVSVSGQAYRFIDAPGTLTVTPRAITVTADNQSRVYGNANPVSHLSGRRLRPGQWRHAVGRAGDTGDSSQQCRRLRHHAGYAGFAELYDILFYRRQPDGHAARDHGDGRCQEPRLW